MTDDRAASKSYRRGLYARSGQHVIDDIVNQAYAQSTIGVQLRWTPGRSNPEDEHIHCFSQVLSAQWLSAWAVSLNVAAVTQDQLQALTEMTLSSPLWPQFTPTSASIPLSTRSLNSALEGLQHVRSARWIDALHKAVVVKYRCNIANVTITQWFQPREARSPRSRAA